MPGDPAAPLVKAIETRYGLTQVGAYDSCLFQGKDKEFESDEILLGTYPIGKDHADQLETILIVGGEHQTARGIRIGMSCLDVVNAYGEGYILDYDEMRYEVDGVGSGAEDGAAGGVAGKSTGGTQTKPVLVFLFDMDTEIITGFYMMLGSR